MSKQEKGAEGIFREFGLVIEAREDDLWGEAPISSGMHLDDSGALRMAMLVTWADMIFGVIAIKAIAPSVPVTLEMDIHLFRPVRAIERIGMRARLSKAGKTVLVFGIDFYGDQGEHLGFGHSMFMALPDPNFSLPPGDWAVRRFAERRGELLAQPLAQRVGCATSEPGRAVLPKQRNIGNTTGAINGGILAVPIEDAALSAAPPGASLASLLIRYLRPVREGPAVAVADVEGDLARVEVFDGQGDALSISATARLFPA